MNLPLLQLCMILIVLVGVNVHAAESRTYEGGIRINTRHVIFVLDGKEYRWNSDTVCRDPMKVKMTCETLVQVGYAQRARVVLSGDKATSIDVLDLQQ